MLWVSGPVCVQGETQVQKHHCILSEKWKLNRVRNCYPRHKCPSGPLLPIHPILVTSTAPWPFPGAPPHGNNSCQAKGGHMTQEGQSAAFSGTNTEAQGNRSSHLPGILN